MTGEQTDEQPAKENAAQVRETVEAVYRAESRRVFATLVRLLGDFDRAIALEARNPVSFLARSYIRTDRGDLKGGLADLVLRAVAIDG